ncbi:MAG: hypothetical protein FWC39_00735 [Bacteroidetes bacterium]|nr:hypothetical protein [Bacteroidota bacterium]
MKFKNITKIFSILTGIIFLISGIGKALTTSEFIGMIMSYGFRDFSFVAPLIAWIEIIIGLTLVFRLYSKQVSFIAILFLVLVTCIYIYGYFRHNITDCGCFGVVSSLNKMPPVLVVIRNLLLIIMLLIVYRQSGTYQYCFTLWITVVIICVISISSFFMGYNYYPPFVSLNNDVDSNYEGKILSETPLSNFITTSKDSTYLLFIFSYICPHCLNSIENLKQYENAKVVDRVIGLVAQDSVYEVIFKQNFQVEFPIKHYDHQTISSIAKGLPTTYYIKNNVIKKEIIGELPCVYNFTRLYYNNE